MEREVTLTYSDQVEQYVRQYSAANNENTQQALDRFVPYDQLLRALFIESGVPEELRYLALSYYLDMETSSALSGPFYLTEPVALENNLIVTSYVDERLDLLKAAKVFCVERAKRNEYTSDWPMAIMAYAAGKGELQEAKLLSVDSTFSQVAKRLPYTISSVYPKYVAAVYIGKKHEDLGFISVAKKPTEAISVKKYITLYQMSKSLDIDYKELKRLNPVYLKETIPNDGAYYRLIVPAEAAVEFARLGDTAYSYPITNAYVVSEIKTEEVLLKDTSHTIDNVRLDSIIHEEETSVSELVYNAQKGDILLQIADLFDCKLVQLKRWNGLGDESVYNGYLKGNKKLVIKVDSAKLEYYQQIEKMTSEQRNLTLKKD